MSKKHMTSEERTAISDGLARQLSFGQIASQIGKSPTTVSREIRKHLEFKKTGGFGHCFNACALKMGCLHSSLCHDCSNPKQKKHCAFCPKCNRNCPDFREKVCQKLQKPPYVCNGCQDKSRCTLEKHYYNACHAQEEYRNTLSEAREGISYSEQEVHRLDETISPLLLKGQSINHICANNTDSVMVSRSTIYRLVDSRLLAARNIDLPRKVRYSARKKEKNFKVDRKCRAGRNYQDFLAFRRENPSLPVAQMDSVEGTRGGKVMLTIHFVKAELMLAFLRNTNDSQSVIDSIGQLYRRIGQQAFLSLLPLILTDNGAEFSNPSAIETAPDGTRRTNVFYCDPSSPGQKGSAERNHEFIRYVLPKGSSFDALTQADVSLLMNHINSYSRPGLGNRSPYEVFCFLYGKPLLDALGCTLIPPQDVTLTPTLLKHCSGRPSQEDGPGQRPE